MEDDADASATSRAVHRAEPHRDPDVLLDIPILNVEEIDLEVVDLRARVGLRADVLDLLRLDVGTGVALGRVKLDITGVEARVLLKARLENVAAIIGSVLRTIDRHPQIVQQLASSAGSAVGSVGGRAGKAAGGPGRGTGAAVRNKGPGTGKAADGAAPDTAQSPGATGRGAARPAAGASGSFDDVLDVDVEDVIEGSAETVKDVDNRAEGTGSSHPAPPCRKQQRRGERSERGRSTRAVTARTAALGRR